MAGYTPAMRPQRITPAAGQESVWDYPRPPRVEPTTRRLRVVLAGRVVADTRAGHRVLETSHPPVYYVPRADVTAECLRPVAGTTGCEWKGTARYFDVIVGVGGVGGVGDLAAGTVVRPRAAWSYPAPTAGMEVLRDAVAFYAALFDECTVDGQRVTPQPGGFYGGWVTPDVVGPFKGGPGTAGW